MDANFQRRSKDDKLHVLSLAARQLMASELPKADTRRRFGKYYIVFEKARRWSCDVRRR